jgi:hypothetical protein
MGTTGTKRPARVEPLRRAAHTGGAATGGRLVNVSEARVVSASVACRRRRLVVQWMGKGEEKL